jgi:hypothetical protein
VAFLDIEQNFNVAVEHIKNSYEKARLPHGIKNIVTAGDTVEYKPTG